MKTISCDDRRLSLIVKHSAGAQPNRAPYGKPRVSVCSEDNSLMTSFIFNRRVITARALPHHTRTAYQLQNQNEIKHYAHSPTERKKR